jgi:hypothetical protein
MAAAGARGLYSKREVSLYVTLMMILGIGFADDPQLPWVADLLDETVIAHPTVRIENLFAETLAYLDATAGPNCGLVVRAMLRIRDFDLAAVPATTGELWIADVLRILNGFYPQKFAFQGAAATRAMAELGIRRAAAYGLTEPVGVFVFLECMFMLGSGFDHDPLQPWASNALIDLDIADGRLRAERLYAGAMAHLAQSLSSEHDDGDQVP